MEGSNIYGVVLAGGKGTRMGNVEKPKQFMEIGNKPIIVHTIEKFVVNTQFDQNSGLNIRRILSANIYRIVTE